MEGEMKGQEMDSVKMDSTELVRRIVVHLQAINRLADELKSSTGIRTLNTDTGVNCLGWHCRGVVQIETMDSGTSIEELAERFESTVDEEDWPSDDFPKVKSFAIDDIRFFEIFESKEEG